MESDEPVFQGFLFLPPGRKILKKTWQKKYCVLYKRSSSGIARIEIYDNEALTGQVKIITLEDVIKITPKSPNLINIVTKNFDMDYGTTSEKNLNEWFTAIKSVAFPDDNSNTNSIEQNNDLYCSSDEGVFYVKLHPSEASQRCNLQSKVYVLIITATALQLRTEEDNKLLFYWPFSYIRKYGYKGGKFTFEAGRKCASGEGVFYLEHPNHNEIYRCLSMRMESMKKLIHGESMPSIIDSNDSRQLQAVLSMEPGSRNPLPLSLTTPNSFQETKASLGLRLTTSVPSLTCKPIPKKPPRKSLPPKNMIPVVTHHDSNDYADVNVGHDYADIGQTSSKYDIVEDRKDAWKTLGLDEPPHSEDFYISWGDVKTLKKSNSEAKLTEAPAIITERNTTPDSEYYDCLQHFGSSNALNTSSGYKTVPQTNKSNEKLNNSEEEYASWGSLTKSMSEAKLNDKTHAPTVIAEPMQSVDDQGYDHLKFFGQLSTVKPSSDYKQVKNSIPPSPVVKTDVNLYEEVNLMEAARSADDSHLGYARIRKDSSSGILKEIDRKQEEAQRVIHQMKNEQQYAVISKPKRV